MTEKRQLEFFLLRYMPDAVKGEFVNIGLVMIEAPTNGGGFADVRFTKDWRRLLCLDPQADIEMLRAVERDLRRQVTETRNCELIMQRLDDSLSNLIQISASKACLTTDPTAEIEKMAGMYLETMRVRGWRAVSGRQMILTEMREKWEQAGVWESLQHDLAAAPYTYPGDPFAFDFGYRVGGGIKLFHAVSMKAGVDAAVTLAARYPRIAKGMLGAKESLVPTLTAVVEDELDRNRQEIGFALQMMEESRIRVAAVGEMAEIAEVARQELGV
jgi:hypothetical protein